MLKLRFKNIFSFLVIILILFTGCGKKGKEKTTGTKEKSNSINLQMHITDTLNPLSSFEETVRDALFLSYEPLFKMDKELKIKGVLAESYKISDDSLSVIIKLKDSVLWHDKKPFTANDVLYTIDYILNSEESFYKEAVSYIEEVKALDDHSLRLTLNRPYAQIAYSLYFPIIPSHIENINEKIVGTGPFMQEEYIHSSELYLKKNPHWHGGEAKCDYVHISMTRKRAVASTSFVTGVINAVTNKSYDLSNYAITESSKAKKYPSANYEFLAFNHASPLFSSEFARSAISYAIDRSEIVKSGYNSYAIEANSPLHPSSPSISPSPTLLEYSIKNAQELLFYDGYSLNEDTGLLQSEDGKTVDFTILVNEENEKRLKCADLIYSQLIKAGINASIKAVSFDEYTRAIENGQFDAYLGGTRFLNIYDFEFLFGKDGSLNTFSYSDDYMELALSQIACASSEGLLQDACENFEEVFFRTQPVCGLVFESDVLITSKKIKGETSPLLNSPYSNIHLWKIK